MPVPDPAPPLLRVCLDLNVWVADFLATRRGRRGGSGPWLMDAVRTGTSPAGPLQLVVSLGMLERLGSVLVRALGVDTAVTETALRAIAGIASLGPVGDHPMQWWGRRLSDPRRRGPPCFGNCCGGRSRCAGDREPGRLRHGRCRVGSRWFPDPHLHAARPTAAGDCYP